MHVRIFLVLCSRSRSTACQSIRCPTSRACWCSTSSAGAPAVVPGKWTPRTPRTCTRTLESESARAMRSTRGSRLRRPRVSGGRRSAVMRQRLCGARSASTTASWRCSACAQWCTSGNCKRSPKWASATRCGSDRAASCVFCSRRTASPHPSGVLTSRFRYDLILQVFLLVISSWLIVREVEYCTE